MNEKNEADPVETQETALSVYLDGLLATQIQHVERSHGEGEIVIEEYETSAGDLGGDAPHAQWEEKESPENVPQQHPFPEEGEFSVLTFQLGNMQFAVVADQIRETLPLPEPPVVTQQEAARVLGISDLSGLEVTVVDTAELILPGKGANQEYGWLLLLRSANLALACQAVMGERFITPDQVRWREQRGSRPWLLGMMSDSPCALIDVETLVAGLDETLV